MDAATRSSLALATITFYTTYRQITTSLHAVALLLDRFLDLLLLVHVELRRATREYVLGWA